MIQNDFKFYGFLGEALQKEKQSRLLYNKPTDYQILRIK